MNHLDEGTIHAWLDGALDAQQARDAEAHVAHCAACSAAVAEARGLVAGASRILTALDDVPAGVIPRRNAPRRQWRAARWVTGIAAALMLAVGVTTWNRNAVTHQAQLKAESTPDAAPIASPAPSVARDLGTAPAVSSAPALPSPAIATGATHERLQSAAQAPPAATNQTAARRSAPTDAAIAPAAPGVLAAAGAAAVAGEVKGADQRMRSAPVVTDVVVTARAERADAALDPAAFAGCYRTAHELRRATVGSEAARDRTVVGDVGRGAASVEKQTRRAASAPMASAPAPAEKAPDFMVTMPDVVALDTTRAEGGYVVRGAANGPRAGTWTPLGTDSARVTMPAGTITVSRTNRTTCP